MRKLTLILTAALLLVLAGCGQPNGGDGGSGGGSQTLASGEVSGKKYLVQKGVVEDSGISWDVVAYGVGDDTRLITFSVMKATGNGGALYKGMISVQSKAETFTGDEWDQQDISAGAGNSFYMTGAVKEAYSEGGASTFMIIGSLTEANVSTIKNAQQLTVTLANSKDSSASLTFPVVSDFCLAVFKHL